MRRSGVRASIPRCTISTLRHVVEHIKEEYPQLAAQMSTLHVDEYATTCKKMPILGPQKASPHVQYLEGRCQALGLRG